MVEMKVYCWIKGRALPEAGASGRVWSEHDPELGRVMGKEGSRESEGWMKEPGNQNGQII